MPRTAGDTWDIVTSVGFTALAVCAARALDAGLDPPLANDPFAAGFVTAAGEPNLIAAVADTDMTSAAAFNAQWFDHPTHRNALLRDTVSWSAPC